MFNPAKNALKSAAAQATGNMSAPNPLPQYIYKILPHSSVDSKYAFPIPIPASHEFFVSPLDAKDGYFHLSTPSQVLGTLDRFFGDVPAVTLLRVDYGRVSAWKTIKWEQAGSGVYPHLYAHSIEGENVDSFRDFYKQEGGEKGWDAVLAKARDEGWFV